MAGQGTVGAACAGERRLKRFNNRCGDNLTDSQLNAKFLNWSRDTANRHGTGSNRFNDTIALTKDFVFAVAHYLDEITNRKACRKVCLASALG